MTDSLRSVLVGTSALTVVLAAALLLTLGRPTQPRDARTHDRLARLAFLAIGVQAVHFLEELLTGFRIRFPATLELEPWPTSFFVVFNLLWIAIWLTSIAGLRRGIPAALFPIWFLAIAMAGNGVAHVILAFGAGGYFPGLVSAPVAAVIGTILFARLMAATRR